MKDEQIIKAVESGFKKFEEKYKEAKRKEAKRKEAEKELAESPLMQMKPRDFKLWSNRSRSE